MDNHTNGSSTVVSSDGTSSGDGNVHNSSIQQALVTLEHRKKVISQGGTVDGETSGQSNGIEWKDMTMEQKEITLKRRFKNCMIYVKNLPYKIKIEDLKTLFGKFGEVANIALGSEDATLGTAIIVFVKPKDAKSALNALRGFKVRDRYLIVQPYDAITMKEKIEQQIEKRREQLGEKKMHKRQKLSS
eukprot:g2613.t1